MTTESLISLAVSALELDAAESEAYELGATGQPSERAERLREAIELVKTLPVVIARLQAVEELIEAIDAEHAVEGSSFDPGTPEEQKAALLTEIRARKFVLEKRAAWERTKGSKQPPSSDAGPTYPDTYDANRDAGVVYDE